MTKKAIKLTEDQEARIRLIQIHMSEQNGYETDITSAIDYAIQACEDMIIESQ